MQGNREIQAAHHILSLFERTKANSEKILDQIPGIFCVVDSDGTIFRGNDRLAEIMCVDPEHLLRRSFKELVSEANWTSFKKEIDGLYDFTQGQRIEFELELDRISSKKSYIWYLAPMEVLSKKGLQLVTVVGMDVTKLKQVTNEKARMESELIVAKAVQENLLPDPVADFGTVKISGSYQSATECSGDWWYYTLCDEKLYLCIGDVTGHGASSALVTSTARTFFSMLPLMKERSPGELASRLNKVIFETTKSQKYMTMDIACIDLKTKVLTHTAAGHVPILHIRPKDGRVTKAEISDLSLGPTSPLGSTDAPVFTNNDLPLSKGDWLYFFTDGVLDLRTREGRSLGPRQMYKFICQALNQFTTPKDVVGDFEKSMSHFRIDEPLVDDVTFFFAQIL